MAKKKRAAPSKLCPKCGKPLHARSKSHEACGWKDVGQKTAPAAATKTEAFPFGANASSDTQKQFQQILELTREIPAEKIRKLLDLAEQLQKI